MGEEAAKSPEEPPEIVLRVEMHCDGCAKKVEKSLRSLEGVEYVKADSFTKTVVVKGRNIAGDPVAAVSERVQKKTRKRVEVVSPLPPPPPAEEEKKEEAPAAVEEEKKEEAPKPTTVILKVRMHCDACGQVLHRRIKKIEGVESVETDAANGQVVVKGVVDPALLVETVSRKARRPATIVVQEEEAEKKEEEKPAEAAAEEEKKEAAAGAADDDDVGKLQYLYYWPPPAPVMYHYVDHDHDHRRLYAGHAYSYMPAAAAAYPPPHMFSDENPNACSVM